MTPKQRSAWRKLFTPATTFHPHQIKTSYISVTKIFERKFEGTYRKLLSNCSKNAVLRRVEMVQSRCFFWHQPKTCFLLCCKSTFFIMLSELRFVKWVRFFEQNCIVKWVIFFTIFNWLWHFLPQNLKIVGKLQVWVF